MTTSVKTNITRGETWVRALYMVLFGVIYNVAEIVLLAVVVLQFVLTLLTGKTNARLLSFGDALSTYVYQIFRFLTYNTEDKPFPFGPWPSTDEPQGQEETSDPPAAETPEDTSEQSDKNKP
jgi:hypothetical protein